MSPVLRDTLHAMTPSELREVIAAASGLHAHHDRDNGQAIAGVLRRVADRLTGEPRKAAH